ncbi:insulinase family protein [Halomonas shantousis]
MLHLSSRPAVGAWLVVCMLLGLAGCQQVATSDPVAEVVDPIQSPNDNRDYRALTLENGLEVLLISDPEADKAAAAMNVAVGSDNDPEDIPGLAHFLEHMLFLGTDRYPQAEGYQRFISQHGGNHNAFTADRDTNYFFDIEPQALPEALDRFSRFFIAPQFNPDYVDRERNAVDSEYQARRRDDSRRINEALGQALNPEHPATRFSVGSLETLTDGKQPLRQALIDFYRHHYGANVMHLAVLGPQPLDTLERLVRERFANVPDRDLSRPEIPEALVTDSELPARLQVQALQQERLVRFLFPVPDPIDDYRNKPSEYIANLLGHEGEGSLLEALREAGWADGLSAGTAQTDGDDALFAVSISLTPEGAHHLDRIQASLFDQIARLRQQGVEQWRYAEQARLAEQEFRFQQRGEPIHTVSSLAMSLAYYPLEDVQYAPYRMDAFDAERIHAYLDEMTPQQLLRVYSGPDVEGQQTTAYFDAPYTLTRVEQWPEAEPLPGLALPSPNPFIAEDLTLEDVDADTPVTIVDSSSVELWHLPDSDFGTPRVEWRFSLQNPGAAASARDAALTRLLAGWLNDSLNARFYPARLAGQEFGAYAHARGMTLTFSGWRDRQDRLMHDVVDQLLHGDIDDASVARAKLGLQRKWRNAPQDALYQQMYRTLGEALIRPQWPNQALLEAIEPLNAADVRAYRERFLRQLHVQAMAVGNLDAELARREGLNVANALAPDLSEAAIPELVPLKVPESPPELHPQTGRNEYAVLRYLQGPDRSLAAQARLAVIGQLIDAPFYTQLRTEEQLGYVVRAGYQPLLDAPGLNLLVQSPDTSSEVIQSRLDAFLKGFDQRIAALDEERLAPYRQAVHDRLLERDQSLGGLTDRLWQTLAYDDITFDRRERLAEQVASLQVEDIRQAWQYLRQAPALNITAAPGASPSDILAVTQNFTPLPAAP